VSLTQTVYLIRNVMPDRAALQHAIDTLGFDLLLDASYSTDDINGFQPCRLLGEETGVEMYINPAQTAILGVPQVTSAVGSRDVAITFRWGGNLSECACAMIISAALATSFDAVVHYEDDDMFYSASAAVDEARAILEELAK
jgi:hypothetical protein